MGVAAGFSSLAAATAAHPNGKSSPEPYQIAAQTNPRGITWRPQHNLISLISLIGLMQAPHPRNTHTAVAIKQAKRYPTVNLHSEPTQTAPRKPSGYLMTPPILSDKSDRSDRSDLSVTPCATRIPPQPSSKHYSAAHLRPSHTTQRQANPQGIPRRPFFVRQVRQVRQVRLKRHAPATRIPPQPSRTHTPAHALAR